jgi:hypothetical protein
MEEGIFKKPISTKILRPAKNLVQALVATETRFFLNTQALTGEEHYEPKPWNKWWSTLTQQLAKHYSMVKVQSFCL